MKLSVGEIVDAYEVLEFVASGAQGDVYRVCERGRRDNVYALKVMRAEKGTPISDVHLQRMQREVEIQSGLRHTHIVSVHKALQVHGQTALLLGWVAGPSLEEVMSSEHQPVWALEEAMRVLRPLAQAVAYMHAQGVVHRDLKPDNILLDRSDPHTPWPGHLRVTDFGVARQTETQTLTKTGVVLGTPLYMAPEQFAGASRCTPASDVFSLGVILYRLLSGDTGQERGQPLGLALWMGAQGLLEKRGDVLRAWGVQDDVVGVILRALSRDALDRFRDAQAFAEALQHVTVSPVQDRSVHATHIQTQTLVESPQSTQTQTHIEGVSSARVHTTATLREGDQPPSTQASVTSSARAVAEKRSVGKTVAMVVVLSGVLVAASWVGLRVMSQDDTPDSSDSSAALTRIPKKTRVSPKGKKTKKTRLDKKREAPSVPETPPDPPKEEERRVAPPEEYWKGALDAYVDALDALNRRDSRRFAAVYRERLECYYRVSGKERSALVRTIIGLSDYRSGELRLEVDRSSVEVLENTRARAVFRVRGWDIVGRVRRATWKYLEMERSQGRWQILSEVGVCSAGASCRPMSFTHREQREMCRKRR